MPFRFRKIIPLGKGFRINLSKSGISSSVGGKGFTLNFGKRGVRPTISAPGTGLSYTPSMGAGDNATSTGKTTSTVITGIVSIILICIISICCIGFIFSDSIGSSTPTPFVLVPLETIVYGTSSAAKAQTRSASTLIVAPATSTIFILPTQELQVIPSQSFIESTLAPTWTPLPTFTPFVLNTLPVGSGSVCSCSGDLYDCKDFSTHAQAQACFNYCIQQGRGDIHMLDANNDNDACESLP